MEVEWSEARNLYLRKALLQVQKGEEGNGKVGRKKQ